MVMKKRFINSYFLNILKIFFKILGIKNLKRLIFNIINIIIKPYNKVPSSFD